MGELFSEMSFPKYYWGPKTERKHEIEKKFDTTFILGELGDLRGQKIIWFLP